MAASLGQFPENFIFSGALPTTPRKTLLIIDLPHHKTPYLPWTCPIVEHPFHLGPSSTWNTVLTFNLHHRGTPYSHWTGPTTEHPSHRGPVPPRKTLLILDLPQVVHPTHSTELDLQNNLQGKGTSDKHYTDRYSD